MFPNFLLHPDQLKTNVEVSVKNFNNQDKYLKEFEDLQKEMKHSCTSILMRIKHNQNNGYQAVEIVLSKENWTNQGQGHGSTFGGMFLAFWACSFSEGPRNNNFCLLRGYNIQLLTSHSLPPHNNPPHI